MAAVLTMTILTHVVCMRGKTLEERTKNQTLVFRVEHLGRVIVQVIGGNDVNNASASFANSFSQKSFVNSASVHHLSELFI